RYAGRRSEAFKGLRHGCDIPSDRYSSFIYFGTHEKEGPVDARSCCWRYRDDLFGERFSALHEVGRINDVSGKGHSPFAKSSCKKDEETSCWTSLDIFK